MAWYRFKGGDNLSVDVLDTRIAAVRHRPGAKGAVLVLDDGTEIAVVNNATTVTNTINTGQDPTTMGGLG